jgi:hypothetical protein
VLWAWGVGVFRKENNMERRVWLFYRNSEGLQVFYHFDREYLIDIFLALAGICLQ